MRRYRHDKKILFDVYKHVKRLEGSVGSIFHIQIIFKEGRKRTKRNFTLELLKRAICWKANLKANKYVRICCTSSKSTHKHRPPYFTFYFFLPRWKRNDNRVATHISILIHLESIALSIDETSSLVTGKKA